ncbi:peptidyl-prolyl cis-trans isomerase FKBP8-like isoform X2 [Dermochelys coriacea]|uniref:peptidyl-prolyl cis-trans isomerase FKBP8-like isoform X2 n=1 Tax=Dermochelys coriacea TaxID=27794 RepID=UPI001CA8A8DD|nr:peptidyl-prolyl cis-trans isomerase FKBP8-like isoform X2 [Dermochelys coriacea]
MELEPGQGVAAQTPPPQPPRVAGSAEPLGAGLRVCRVAGLGLAEGPAGMIGPQPSPQLEDPSARAKAHEPLEMRQAGKEGAEASQRANQPASAGPAAALELEGSPCLGRVVKFLLPHTTIEAPLPQEEEQQFYQGLERLLGPKYGRFGQLFAAAGWADVTEDRFLRKLLVREGQGEASRPQPGQEVTVKLLGVLEDGSLVEKDPALTFTLEQGDVIQALELGVQSMQLGEVSFLLTSFQYAYGHLGRDPDIPSDASLLYEVTLLQIRDSSDLGLLPPSTRISLSKQKRERGNFHFEREEYQRAMQSYQLALGILDSPGAVRDKRLAEELQEHQVKCLNNCAASQLKLQLFEEVLTSCSAVLHIDPDNVKALYRKGKLLSERGEDQEAMNILKRALQLEPTAKAIHAELSKLAKRQKGQPERPAPTDVDDLVQPAACQSTWVHRLGPTGTLVLLLHQNSASPLQSLVAVTPMSASKI